MLVSVEFDWLCSEVSSVGFLLRKLPYVVLYEQQESEKSVCLFFSVCPLQCPMTQVHGVLKRIDKNVTSFASSVRHGRRYLSACTAQQGGQFHK
jgi:hypothetical protein